MSASTVSYIRDDCIDYVKNMLSQLNETASIPVKQALLRDLYRQLSTPAFLAFVRDHRIFMETTIHKVFENAVNEFVSEDTVRVLYGYLQLLTGVIPDPHFWGHIAGLSVRRLRRTPVPAFVRNFHEFRPLYDLICRLDAAASVEERAAAATDVGLLLLERASDGLFSYKGYREFLYSLRLSVAFVPGVQECVVRRLLLTGFSPKNCARELSFMEKLVVAAVQQRRVSFRALVPPVPVVVPTPVVTPTPTPVVTPTPTPAPASIVVAHKPSLSRASIRNTIQSIVERTGVSPKGSLELSLHLEMFQFAIRHWDSVSPIHRLLMRANARVLLCESIPDDLRRVLLDCMAKSTC